MPPDSATTIQITVENNPVMVAGVDMLFSEAADGSDIRQELVMLTFQAVGGLKMLCVNPTEAARLRDMIDAALASKPTSPPDSHPGYQP